MLIKPHSPFYRRTIVAPLFFIFNYKFFPATGKVGTQMQDNLQWKDGIF